MCDAIARQAARLHQEAYVVDGHADTVLGVAAGRDFASRSDGGHVDLPRLVEGGVDLQVFAVFVDAAVERGRRLLRALELTELLLETLAGAGVPVVRTAPQLRAGRGPRALLGLEGGDGLEGSLAALRIFHRLGVRLLGLTWNYRNELADGVGEAAAAGGLSAFGRQVVAEANRLGILLDVSHLAEPGFWQVLEHSRQPVVASHCCARALCDHPRNLWDTQLRALARSGGVVGINFNPPFLRPGGGATLEDVLRHIDHVADVAGIEAVGLGSDFDGIDQVPRGLEDPSKLPALTEGLLRRGYPEEAVRQILGGNFLRVLEGVLAPVMGPGA